MGFIPESAFHACRPEELAGVELAFLLGCQGGYGLNYTLWDTGVMKCESE